MGSSVSSGVGVAMNVGVNVVVGVAVTVIVGVIVNVRTGWMVTKAGVVEEGWGLCVGCIFVAEDVQPAKGKSKIKKRNDHDGFMFELTLF